MHGDDVLGISCGNMPCIYLLLLADPRFALPAFLANVPFMQIFAVVNMW